MMRTPPAFSWLCNFLMMINICSTLILLPLLSLQAAAAAAGQSCLRHERSLLLQLNNTLTFDLDPLPWDRSTDCCTWDGVRCQEGRVVGLDLSDKSISGGLTHNSSLFQFQYLKTLDLSLNNFSTPMPSSFGNLTSLTHLNLADSGFVGQIPIELSGLTNLVTLDFTTTLLRVFPRSPLLKVHQSNWSMSFQNLTKLEELRLDFVDMSAAGKEWGQVFSSSLPNLRVLTMTGCSLSGPIHHSLRNLHSLSLLCLDGNPLSSPVPRFIANFPRLTSLKLSNCGLYGTFPQEIFQVPSLEYVDVSFNPLLQGSFPEFPQNNSLQYLELSNTSFSGRIPTSINNLANLSTLDLSKSRFNGTVPNFMLTKLVYLDLSANKFTGLIPSSLFKAASLERIDLSDNEFHGQLPDFPNVSPSVLQHLYLGRNNLEGPIPMSIFELKNLSYLSLPFNNLNGTIQLESTLKELVNLIELDLSYNNLSVAVDAYATAPPSFPEGLSTLSLASCRLNAFPNLKNHSSLTSLDLSNNQIHGTIPNWVCNLGFDSFGLTVLNLSHNYLEGIQEPYSPPTYLNILDLNSNQILGKLPTLPPSADYIDFSSNNFSSSIPFDIGKNLSSNFFLSLSHNGLTGVIPQSICEMTSAKFVDFSSNNLSGKIPECMYTMTSTSLIVLNLRGNHLSGAIPDSFAAGCGLRTLDLHGNSMEGKIPKSLAYCTGLEVLDLGNNHLIDEFPCFLNNISSLQVLILRANKFRGSIGCHNANINESSWAKLQIIDLAHNSFSGQLPGRNFLTNWKAMMSSPDEKLSHLQIAVWEDLNYVVSTAITMKGQDTLLVKILTAQTCIDFSSNDFNGRIPEEFGALRLLHVLNLSSNAFSGPIPGSLGELQNLESLDLSWNELSGTIPTSLASLNFLSHLNLSFNKLVGMIPSGTQFQTFSANSFIGNRGLHGCPLTTNCTQAGHQSPPSGDDKSHSTHSESKKIDWDLLSVEIGFIVGFGSLIGPLVFCKRWRNLYYETAEDVAFRILPLAVTRKWVSRTATR